MRDRERVGKRTAAVLLAAIVLGASALAIRWVFLVPIYQSPDEPQHFDYAISLRDHGRFFRALPFDGSHRFAHPWAKYLLDSASTESIMFNAEAKVPPGYGTRAYYRALDRHAPQGKNIQVTKAPALAIVYPYGYYLTLAGWLKIVGLFSQRVTVTFFAARIFSVVLLACSLVLSYLAARELRIGRLTALVATAIVGFFPMTTFVASYVQPDNLAFALVSLGFYLVLRSARRGGPWSDLTLLGLTWGWLLVTKPHFFVCLVAASIPLLASRVRLRRWPLAVLLLAWSWLPLWSIFAWITHGIPSFYSAPTPLPDLILGLSDRIQKAMNDYFRGSTHISFWGYFGWLDTPLELAAPVQFGVALRFLVMAGTWLILGLTLVQLEKISSRLVRAATRGHWKAATRALVSNPVMNMYFLFFGLMLYAYVRMDNRFGAQGRNWIPVMFPIMLTAIRFAPRALTLRKTQTIASTILAGALIAYVSVGSVYGLRAIKKRYYLPLDHYVVHRVPVPVNPTGVNLMTWADGQGDTQGPDSYLAYVLPNPRFVRSVEIRLVATNPRHERIQLKVSWANRKHPNPTPGAGTVTFWLPPGAGERRLVLPINEAVELIRIHPDMKPCHVEVKSVMIHQPVRRLAMR